MRIVCMQVLVKTLAVFMGSVVLRVELVHCKELGVSDETSLHDHIFSNYRVTRPAWSWTDTVKVEMSFNLYQLLQLDGRSQVMKTYGQLALTWNDTNLGWNPMMFNNMTRTSLSAKRIWIPDISLLNSVETIRDPDWLTNFQVNVLFNGKVIWMPMGIFETSCELDMTRYPFDSQKCTLEFGSIVHPEFSVNVTVPEPPTPPIRRTFYSTNGEFSLTEIDAETSRRQHPDIKDVTFSEVIFTLHVKRKPMFFLINIISPCVLLSLLGLLVFCMPGDSGEKIGLEITVILSFSVFLLLVSENLPVTSDYFPILSIYLLAILLITSLSLVTTVLVVSVHFRQPPTRMPAWFHQLVLGYMSRLVLLNKEVEKLQTEEQKIVNGQKPETAEKKAIEASLIENDGNMIPYLQMEMLEQLKKLVLMQEKAQPNPEEEIIVQELKLMANILDRFFLALFLTVMILVNVVMLGIIPATDS